MAVVNAIKKGLRARNIVRNIKLRSNDMEMPIGLKNQAHRPRAGRQAGRQAGRNSRPFKSLINLLDEEIMQIQTRLQKLIDAREALQ